MGVASGGKRILIVEDDPSLRELMNERLADAGYVVQACADGRAALEALQRDTYDAVLSDVRMPDMDGLSLLRAVREKDLDLPVVLCTGGPSLESAIQAVEHGALEYLVKPISSEKLLQTAGRAVKLGALARLKREALATTGFDQLVGDKAGLEASFKRALDALWMAFQPIVYVSGDVAAHEALLRTTERNFSNPGIILNAAERLERLAELGRAIREYVAELMTRGLLTGDVFLNLHPLDLADDHLADPRAPLSRFASRVVLEVTERASLEGVADVPGRVKRLRRLGYRIALDDLGAGYAGLASFAALSPEIVKVDMSLVRGLDEDTVRQKIVGSMAGLCRELGIPVVAEGIETAGERDAAVRAGCDLLQGFFIGRPSRMELGAGGQPTGPR